jgi:hypothetical protein
MLSIENEPIMMRVIMLMLCVIMLSVVAPFLTAKNFLPFLKILRLEH